MGKKKLVEAPIPQEILDRAEAHESMTPEERIAWEKKAYGGPLIPDDFDPDAETADLDGWTP